MVTGIESFKEWFRGNKEQYAIIGGTACDILMTEEGLDFRATKDIDLVLIIEAVDADFGRKLWEYVKQAGYEHCNRSSGIPQFYRFSNPASSQYPVMIELFTRKLDAINLPDDAVLTPLPMYEDIQEFIRRMKNEKVDAKQLGLAARTKEEILKEIQEMYILHVFV